MFTGADSLNNVQCLKSQTKQYGSLTEIRRPNNYTCTHNQT